MEENLNVCSLSERWINKLWFSHEMEFHSELSRNKTLTLETKPAHLPASPLVETQGRRRTWVTWDGPQASDDPKQEAGYL